MTTAATSLLGLALPVTGELSGTWGDTVNNSITALLDSAVAGTTTLSADADVTLTTTTLAANQAREAIILWTAGGTVTRNITAPAQSKTYVVLNKTSSTQSIVIRGVGPTTGVTVLAGKQAMVAWDGTDFVEVSSGYVDGPASSTDNAVARFDGTDGKLIQNSVVIIADTTGNMSGVGTLSSGAVTSSSLTATRVLYAGTAGLIQDSANMTFSGTVLTSSFAGPLNGTVGATTPAAGSFTTLSTTSTVTLSGGTANGVAYLNGSKVLTTGSALTFDGTNLGVSGNANFGNAGSSTYGGYATGGRVFSLAAAGGVIPAISASTDTFASSTAIRAYTKETANDTSYAFDIQTGNGTGVTTQKLQLTWGANGLWNSTGLKVTGNVEITQSQLIGYSSYAGIGTNGLAVAGSVGIGTDSPGTKLEVAGAGKFTAGNVSIAPSTATNNAVFIASNTGGTFFAGLDSSTGASFGVGNYSAVLYNGANTPMVFFTNGTERMRLDSAGNVGIGTSSPSASAILDAQSTTKGVRMPNMTTTQKNAIASPAAGLMVFDTTLAKLCVYSGSAWQTITSI